MPGEPIQPSVPMGTAARLAELGVVCAWAGSECYNRADEPCAPSPSCVCTNACVGAPGWAADGWCDDGGPGFSTRACELGTDCDDCGDSCRARVPRMEASPAPEDAFVGPEEEVVIVQ